MLLLKMAADGSDEINRFAQAVRGREVTNDNTLDSYIRWVERFETWHTEASPTETAVREFDRYLASNDEFLWNMGHPLRNDEDRPGYAYRTRVKALSAVKLWMRFHYGVEIETEVQNLALGEAPDYDPDWLSGDDCERIIATADEACDNEECKTLLRLSYDAILRAAEAASVERDDISLDRGTIYVRAKKGSMNAEIGLDDVTVARLREHINAVSGRDRLFRNAYDRAWKPNALAQHFRRCHHEVGIHSFSRHSPIIHRLNDGEPFGDVMRRARHTNATTTMRYARLVGAEIPPWVEDR